MNGRPASEARSPVVASQLRGRTVDRFLGLTSEAFAWRCFATKRKATTADSLGCKFEEPI
jgi:hypothetical protein